MKKRIIKILKCFLFLTILNFASENVFCQIKNNDLLDFDDYVVMKWNNVLMLDLKKLEDDGFLPISCRWFENGKVIGVATSYSAGNNEKDKLKNDAIYKFEIKTLNATYYSTEKQFTKQTPKTLNIFPNPINNFDFLTIEYENTDNNVSFVELYDEAGILVFKKNFNKITTISINLKSGVYIIKINDNYNKVIVN